MIAGQEAQYTAPFVTQSLVKQFSFFSAIAGVLGAGNYCVHDESTRMPTAKLGVTLSINALAARFVNDT